ncbi:long-chain fatty acid--CoA ligase [Brenneria sp. 4F2]|nr:long-chain fatty acid--CoA ligase [Brenneria bubanii]
MNSHLQPYHVVQRIQQQIALCSGRTVLREWTPAGEVQLTWSQAGRRIRNIAKALLAQKLDVQARVAIFSCNTINWSLVDLAILHLRAVSVPLYATDNAEQAAFILNDAAIGTIFVGNQVQFDTLLTLREVCPRLRHIIVMEDGVDLRGCDIAMTLREFENQPIPACWQGELQRRIDNRDLNDLFTLIYTSGTTSLPKGVMLDYVNIAMVFKLHDGRLNLSDNDISLCFMPLSHVFERTWSLFAMHRGAQNVYLRDSRQVRAAIQAVKPTVMCAVPRFYEKTYSAIHDNIASAPWYRRLLFRWAVAQGQRISLLRHVGKPPEILRKLMHHYADRLVLRDLRQSLGGRVRFLPVAGAFLDDTILLFFLSIDIRIIYGYGMTETSATIACWDGDKFRLGSVGKPLPEISIRIGENNEIQVRGDTVMRGYFRREQETAKVFTADGWLKTGDVGVLDAEGNLFITERLRDLMKITNGEYIAPQYLECILGQDRFIEQVAVVADSRQYVSALIVPCFDVLEEYARSINLKYQSRMELLRSQHIAKLFKERLRERQKALSPVEKVKKFILLPTPFSMEEGELTPTLKLRRKVIHQHYQSEIDAMYSEA